MFIATILFADVLLETSESLHLKSYFKTIRNVFSIASSVSCLLLTFPVSPVILCLLTSSFFCRCQRIVCMLFLAGRLYGWRGRRIGRKCVLLHMLKCWRLSALTLLHVFNHISALLKDLQRSKQKQTDISIPNVKQNG